jgi:hypothetical protein
VKHVTFVHGPDLEATGRALTAGTRFPDEDGEQGLAATLGNTIFHNYDTAVYGKSVTSTVLISGVLGSNVNTIWQTGIVTIQLEFTGPAAFVDETSGDYHLTAASAAIDRGVVTEVTTDLDGQPRNQGSAPDLGAYEYQGSPPEDLDIYIPLIAKLKAPF